MRIELFVMMFAGVAGGCAVSTIVAGDAAQPDAVIGGSDAGTSQPPADPPPVAVDVAVPIPDRYSPVVMMFQGAGAPGDPVDEITSQGFEFVIGAQTEDVAALESVTATLPGTFGTRVLLASAELTGHPPPSQFWGYYGTGEGLPPVGTYRFDFTMLAGEPFTLERVWNGTLVDIARNIVLERQGENLHVRWTDVSGARDYSVAVYSSNEMGATLSDTFQGCQAEPPEVSTSPAECLVEMEGETLAAGQWYIVSVATWSHESPQGVASFAGNHSAPFQW